MKESLYLNRNVAIINFNASYARSSQELLSSSTFANLVRNFIDDLKINNEDLYNYVLQNITAREAAFEIVKLLRQLSVLSMSEVESDYLNDKDKLLEFIEELYNFWKAHQRFSIVNKGFGNAISESSFVQADSGFNQVIRSMYRSIEEKILGRKNSIYRQMQAGTNASMAIRYNVTKLSDKYEKLKNIPFIDSLMLRTPMLLHPRSNKRTGTFENREDNPIGSFTGNPDTWFCYPAKIGSLLAFIYFHRDFISSSSS